MLTKDDLLDALQDFRKEIGEAIEASEKRLSAKIDGAKEEINQKIEQEVQSLAGLITAASIKHDQLTERVTKLEEQQELAKSKN